VRDLCTERNVVLVLDEIQTGLGRTGKLLAQEHEGIQSDLTLLGKALAGGFYPVSAVLANNDVLKVLQPGTHGSTFGGNPLGCVIARAALRVLVEEGMIENARVQGEYLMSQLRTIQSDLIRDVRGRGLMVAIELQPHAGGAYKYCERLRDQGLLAKDTQVDTLRLAPPLLIKRSEIDFACDALAAVFK
jgi:ornithine--oxo-acid transaminase